MKKTTLYVLMASACLFGLTIFAGCKKDPPPEETRQASTDNAGGEIETPDRIEMRILYVGHPGSEREKDFADFLTAHFKLVETGDLANFEENQAEQFDVTIFDYDGDPFKAPRPNISRNYSRATVTLGVVGALICDGQNLKPGYL